ncbi:MAG: hypothetical protein H7282_14805 [Cytophagaceae bacterium]|nr:hypothetical protein [Cytophagaceae bacterium]
MINNTDLPKYLFLFVLCCLVLPCIQGVTHLMKEKALKGDIILIAAPEFTKQGWLEGDYQTVKEKQINEAFGFRSYCIRLNNQIAFTFFNKAQANGVIIGKDNYLYEENYIKAYYGTDFIGEENVRTRMEKLKFVNDTLAKLNKTIIMVVAAGKGFYYPEYIPDSYATKRTRTNVEAYTEYAKKFGIHCIDFNRYFVEQKPIYKHLLYPKNSIHWSVLGAEIAADSLIRYIETVRGIDMPNLHWKETETQYKREEDADHDIEDGMNLMFRLSSEPMAYPKVYFESDSAKTKPSALVIGDSFYWTMINNDVPNVFTNPHYWYYNKQIYPGNGSTDLVNIKDELDRHDVIVIMATPATMPTYGWGFIENAYAFYTNGDVDSNKFGKRVDDFKAFIKSNPVWLHDAQKRARENGISLDSSITLDAIYQVKLLY